MSFGNDLYNTSQFLDNQYYGNSSYGYGGSCGSFSGDCYSSYDSCGLYGDDWGVGGYGYGSDYGLGIDMSPFSSYYDTNYNNYDSCGYGGGYDQCGSYSNYGNNYDIGCSVGYCGSSQLPYYGDSLYSNNYWGYPLTINIDVNNYGYNQQPSPPPCSLLGMPRISVPNGTQQVRTKPVCTSAVRPPNVSTQH